MYVYIYTYIYRIQVTHMYHVVCIYKYYQIIYIYIYLHPPNILIRPYKDLRHHLFGGIQLELWAVQLIIWVVLVSVRCDHLARNMIVIPESLRKPIRSAPIDKEFSREECMFWIYPLPSNSHKCRLIIGIPEPKKASCHPCGDCFWLVMVRVHDSLTLIMGPINHLE